MAGMLPGVEVARRRRFHQSSGWSDSPSTSGYCSTRRPSFCLYTSHHESHLSTGSSLQRGKVNQGYEDEKLGEVAREAKERLDERLRAQWKSSETKRAKSTRQRLRGVEEGRPKLVGNMQREVFGLKKSGSKRFIWSKLSWKASEQDECAVCLDQFTAGDNLTHLPCAHKFHSKCLGPWLETNAHCPCCRMGVLT